MLDLSGSIPDVSNSTPLRLCKQIAQDNSKCPRCGGVLINPESLGLCQGCGYLRTLEEKHEQVVLPATTPLPAASPLANPIKMMPAAPSRLQLADLWPVFESSPAWLWRLLAGIAVIGMVSFLAGRFLPPDSLARALWGTIQVVFGLTLAILTQFYAVLRVSANDAGLGGQHIFMFSGRLWGQVLRQLPKTRWLIWLEAWAITGTGGAVLWIGGFGYWWQIYHPREMVNHELVEAATSWESGEAPTSKPSGFQPGEAKPPTTSADVRPTMQVAIIGYLPDEEGKPEGLVIARLADGKWIAAGMVQRGLLPEQALEMRDRLRNLEQFKPQIPGLLVAKAIWVKPELFCTVHYSGVTRSGKLVDPSFNELLSNPLP